MEYKEEFKQFIKNYLDKYSPFKMGDLVTVNIFASRRPYEITRISVTENGEIIYYVTSPRSFETLPNRFKMNELTKYDES